MLLNARQIQRGTDKDRVILLAIEDITARKDVEAGLEKTRKELEVIKTSADEALEYAESIINTVREPLIVLNQDLRVVTASRSFYEVFKVNPEEIVGNRIYDLGNKQWDISKLRELLEDILPQEAVFDNYEVEHDFSTIGRRIMLLNARQIQRMSGKASIILLAIEDITERKRVQGELQSAKQRAEEATAMKSMFLANMSHEIRTPMNAVIGLSLLALKTAMTSKQHDYVTKIHNAGVTVLSLMNDILDFSKIEAGKLDMEQADFAFDEMVANVSAAVGERAAAKGLEFRLHTTPDIPQHLIGDSLRLGQVILNLINNAVKFTSAGEIGMKVELLEQTGDRAKLRFEVRDTGIGMTREQVSKLFQPFAQADGSTTRQFGGTGLGLSISKRLVELMGGQIWVDSEAGSGSTFIFTAWFRTGSKIAGRPIPAQLSQMKVLVVDDSPSEWKSLIDNLKALAFSVDLATSGEDAVTLVRRHDAADPYRVVFMDWRMPGMDGIEGTRLIKTDPDLVNKPFIVVITAVGSEEIRNRASQVGADGFLVKPVFSSTLVDTIIELCAPDIVVEPSADGRARGAFTLKGARILLVEDNDINQQVAMEFLTGAGAAVEVAGNGRVAVEMLLNQEAAQSPYNIVLMDIQMPEMDGYEATRLIRADARFANLPIIAMTAHAMMEERQRCRAAGMVDHITKPIDPQAMFETIGHWYKPCAATQPVAIAQPAEDGTVEIADIPEIPGIDVADALARIGGNRMLYWSLLRKFVDSQGGVPEAIEDALNRGGDRALAEHLAHTAKGVAGNIGASGVMVLAGQLEQSIRNNDLPEQSRSILASYVRSMSEVVAAIRSALETRVDPPTAAAGQTASRCGIGAILSQLALYLHAGDAESTYYFESVRDSLREVSTAEELSRLDKCIADYDLNGAGETVADLAARWLATPEGEKNGRDQ